MKKFLFSRSALGIGAALAGFAAMPAVAASAATCTPTTALVQPFLAYGDLGWYTPVPGSAVNSFAGTGWTLRGGAKIVQATLANGKSGSVLDLPPGASATSPNTCAPAGLQTGRMLTREVGGSGGASSMYVSLAGSSALGAPIPILGTTGWTITLPLGLLPQALLAPANIDFTIVNSASVGDLQLYNLDIDPRMVP